MTEADLFVQLGEEVVPEMAKNIDPEQRMLRKTCRPSAIDRVTMPPTYSAVRS